MLQVSDLTRCYGSFVAVRNASFAIGRGEIVGLLGHNGAGKTTIMKMISGYLEPDHGQVTIDNEPITDSAKFAQRYLGYLPENLPVYPEMCVADYLDYAAQMKGIVADDKVREIRRVVQATQLAEKFLAPVHTLSRGFKQRVGVAQAILGRPKLLVLDEPTNGLDPTQTEQMRQLIRDIASEATVVISTHIMQEVDAICDRVLILRRGELVVDARLDALRQSNRLLLSCSLPLAAMYRALACCEDFSAGQVAELHGPADSHHYQITLSERQQSPSFRAQVAKVLIDAGAELYQLQAVRRDLESLFKEVSDSDTREEVSDAA